MNAESYKDKKFHDREKYKEIRIMVDRELCDFADGYYNFEKFNSYNECVSVLLERALKELYEKAKAKEIKVIE